MKKTIKIGYARVSTENKQDDSLENQIRLLEEAGCTIIYSEKESGRNDNRVEFNKAIKHLKRLAKMNEYDLYLVVFKNDRLSRKFRTLINTVEDLIEMDINYISLKDNIETETIGGKMFFQMLSAFNEYEVANTRERVKIGLEKARKDGKRLGRPPLKKAIKNKVIRLYELDYLTVQQIADTCEISRKSVYNILEKAKIKLR